MATSSDVNPDAIPHAPDPTVERVEVDGTAIYAEVRGSGPPVLLIGAADEDAEVYRGIAERLAVSNTVLTYDRRGTRRSDSDDWPSDSARHADDAAALITRFGLRDVVVLGASAGGIVTLRLAIRHPDLIKAALCFEPGVFDVAKGGGELRRRVERAVSHHLESNPGDWQGATDVLGKEAVRFVDDLTSLFTPPPGKDWYGLRTAANAESLIRGDLPLTQETFESSSVAACPVALRFSHGTASLPIFRAIATRLASLRSENPDVLEAASHSIFYHPDQATEYIRTWA